MRYVGAWFRRHRWMVTASLYCTHWSPASAVRREVVLTDHGRICQCGRSVMLRHSVLAATHQWSSSTPRPGLSYSSPRRMWQKRELISSVTRCPTNDRPVSAGKARRSILANNRDMPIETDVRCNYDSDNTRTNEINLRRLRFMCSSVSCVDIVAITVVTVTITVARLQIPCVTLTTNATPTSFINNYYTHDYITSLNTARPQK